MTYKVLSGTLSLCATTTGISKPHFKSQYTLTNAGDRCKLFLIADVADVNLRLNKQLVSHVDVYFPQFSSCVRVRRLRDLRFLVVFSRILRHIKNSFATFKARPHFRIYQCAENDGKGATEWVLRHNHLLFPLWSGCRPPKGV